MKIISGEGGGWIIIRRFFLKMHNTCWGVNFFQS